MIELGRQGKSPAQIAANLDVSRKTLDNWAAEHPEFLAAITRAKTLEQAWWEDKGQTDGLTRDFNATVWTKSMQARFREDYTERQEVTGKDGAPLEGDGPSNREIAMAFLSVLRKANVEDGQK